MKTSPNVDIHELKSDIELHYSITVTLLNFSPSGEDAYGYTVRDTDNTQYYLKVYRRTLNWDAVLGIPVWLHQQGLTSVIHALPTTSGKLHLPFQTYTLALYPLIDGLDATRKPLTPENLTEFGRFLARLHAMQPPIRAEVERFDLTNRDAYICVLESLHAAAISSDSYQRELAGILMPLQDRLWQELANFEAAAAAARQENVMSVLCHGDPSSGNIITTDDRLHVIDWDGVILAPKERDLTHFGADDQPDSDPVLQGYAQVAGAFQINPTVIRYYRYQWNIQEVADFGARILFDEFADEAQKAHDLAEMRNFLSYSGLNL